MSTTGDADQSASPIEGDVQVSPDDDSSPLRRSVSPNPATKALIADVVLSAIDKLSRETVETALGVAKSNGADGGETGDDEPVKTSLVANIAAIEVTKLATRSLPGFALVSTGLFAKTLFDRSQNRRKAARNAEADRQKLSDASDS